MDRLFWLLYEHKKKTCCLIQFGFGFKSTQFKGRINSAYMNCPRDTNPQCWQNCIKERFERTYPQVYPIPASGYAR